MTFLNLLIYTGNILLFINVVLYSIKLINRAKIFKIFWLYLLCMLIIQTLTVKLQIQVKNNIHLSHFYFILQFIFLSLFYITLFNSKRQKNIVKVISLLVLIILAIQYINSPSLYYKFNLLEIVLTSLCLVSFSVIHFYNSLIEKTRFVYVNSGIFMYLISSTLIFCSGNFINASYAGLNKLLWLFNSILFIIYQILIFMEWYKNYKKS